MSNTKTMLYVTQSDGCSYEVIIDNERQEIQLGYDNKCERWTSLARGKQAGRLVDHGNGILVELGHDFIQSKKIELEYSEVAELIMLFKALNLDTDWGSLGDSIARYELKED